MLIMMKNAVEEMKQDDILREKWNMSKIETFVVQCERESEY